MDQVNYVQQMALTCKLLNKQGMRHGTVPKRFQQPAIASRQFCTLYNGNFYFRALPKNNRVNYAGRNGYELRCASFCLLKRR